MDIVNGVSLTLVACVFAVAFEVCVQLSVYGEAAAGVGAIKSEAATMEIAMAAAGFLNLSRPMKRLTSLDKRISCHSSRLNALG